MQSSLQACDNKIQKAHCSTHAKGADRCGIFSFFNTSGIRVYGKSCVYERFCESAEEFCKSVSQDFGKGVTGCEIRCCSEEYCNYDSNTASVPKQFADDSEDCGWVDGSVSQGVSGFLHGACALYAMAMVK